MPPGDAINALTVGATHDDSAGDIRLPDTVWDIVDQGSPALYSALGPGYQRSIKPELYHHGGREIYRRPVIGSVATEIPLTVAHPTRLGPGCKVAATGQPGATGATTYSHGTSEATALVTREASRLFEVLEAGPAGEDQPAFPDPEFFPVLVRALLAHSASWGSVKDDLLATLGERSVDRRNLTNLLGYGTLDLSQLGTATTNRAVLIAGGWLACDQQHTYQIPLPDSLRARAERHRFTVTLAYSVPTDPLSAKYRRAKLFFDNLTDHGVGGNRIEAEHHAVRRGTIQHEIYDGSKALTFGPNGSLPIRVQSMPTSQRSKSHHSARYALVVSVETKVETSVTIHDEIRQRLREQTRVIPRVR